MVGGKALCSGKGFKPLRICQKRIILMELKMQADGVQGIKKEAKKDLMRVRKAERDF